MTGAQKLALCAGVAVVAGGGLVHHMPRALGDEQADGQQPSHAQPAHSQPAAHPGQAAARNGAARQAAPATGHGTASGHGATSGSAAATAGHDEHGASDGPAAGTDTHGDAGGAPAGSHAEAGQGGVDAHAAPDALVATYFGQTPDADTVLTVLRDGNSRWVSGHTQNPKTDESTRRDTAENGQHPFATILTCADSRVPVERVFDRGIGELFVVRVAGNVVAETEAGTMEYGVEHLHTPVIVVMGHTGCGAVKAACEGGEAGGNVRFLIGEIEPAVRRAATMHPSMEGVELLEASVRENVMQSMFDLLATSESIRTNVDNGTVRLVGAVYNISTGEVEWMGEHPWQDGLISVLHDRLGLPGRGTATVGVETETTGGRDGH